MYLFIIQNLSSRSTWNLLHYFNKAKSNWNLSTWVRLFIAIKDTFYITGVSKIDYFDITNSQLQQNYSFKIILIIFLVQKTFYFIFEEINQLFCFFFFTIFEVKIHILLKVSKHCVLLSLKYKFWYLYYVEKINLIFNFYKHNTMYYTSIWWWWWWWWLYIK